MTYCSNCGKPLKEPELNTFENQFNIQALLSMIFGICSIVFCWGMGIFSIGFGIAGLVLYFSSKKTDPKNGMALAGLICSIIGLSIGSIFFFSCFFCGGCTFCFSSCSSLDFLDNYY
jgi:hypothetical protein